jgi:hypothetical protein
MSLHPLIPVQYARHRYPAGIDPALLEAPAHFDVRVLKASRPYSMHTEYSAGPRDFSSPLL